MVQGLKLSDEELQTATDSLVNSKLSVSQIEDLISFFRIFLNELASNYSMNEVLTALEDDANSLTCAKLVACLNRWNEIEFDDGGFAPTNANRTGFNASVDVQEFKIFKYAFTLLWDLPAELNNKNLRKGRVRTSQQGRYINTF